eukprot:1721907-Pyramimonas_sp.AAC.1
MAPWGHLPKGHRPCKTTVAPVTPHRGDGQPSKGYPCILSRRPILCDFACQPRSKNAMGLQGPRVLTAHPYDAG